MYKQKYKKPELEGVMLSQQCPWTGDMDHAVLGGRCLLRDDHDQSGGHLVCIYNPNTRRPRFILSKQNRPVIPYKQALKLLRESWVEGGMRQILRMIRDATK